MAQGNSVPGGKQFITRHSEKVGQIRKPVELLPPPEHFVKVATGSLMNLVALMFWKLRRQYPDLAITFDERDIKGFAESLEYNQQAPKLKAEARKDYVVFRVCDEKTGDQIILSENNEEDLRRSEEAAKVRRIKEGAAMLVGNARAEASQGVNSMETVNALCDAVMTLARA